MANTKTRRQRREGNLQALANKRRGNRALTRMTGRHLARIERWLEPELIDGRPKRKRTPRWQKRYKAIGEARKARRDKVFRSVMRTSRFPMRAKTTGRYKRWKASRTPVRTVPEKATTPVT